MVASDQYHEAGAAHFRRLLDDVARLTTSDYVLDEVVMRLRYDVGHAKSAEFLTLIHSAESGEALTILHVDERTWVDAEAIFLRYRDSRLSFTDCTSFALLQDRSIEGVFGFDRHFTMMGYTLRPDG